MTYEKATARITFRVKPSVFEAMQAIAAAEKKSFWGSGKISHYVQHLIHEDLKRRRSALPVAPAAKPAAKTRKLRTGPKRAIV